MRITKKTWSNYIARLSKINEEAGNQVLQYVEQYGVDDTRKLISFVNAVIVKYGEGSAELACEMYEAMAEIQGVFVKAAEPASLPEYREVAKMVNGTKTSPALLKDGVKRLVKRTGADTTLNNALRDHAEFAWVPSGDTCGYCLTLASRGWQRISKKTLKKGHAEHIHANCDCEYTVRFDGKSTVEGYDPDKYLEQYENAEGRTPEEKINSMRRANYIKNKSEINAQKRATYAARKEKDVESTELRMHDKMNLDYSKAEFTEEKPLSWHWEKHASEFPGWTSEQYLERARELLSKPLEIAELEQIERSDGSVSRYCFSTNEFVATTGDGNLRTFFRPKFGKEYWDEEQKRN